MIFKGCIFIKNFIMKHTDPFTGKSFIPKRSNQKFATRKNQIAFNNNKAKLLRFNMAEIDNQIKANWHILNEIMGSNFKLVECNDYLEEHGFDFNYFNSTFNFNSKTYNGIYNFGIRILNEDECEIILYYEFEY